MRNEEQIQQIKQLTKAGQSAAEIARLLHLTRQRVSKIINDYFPKKRKKVKVAKEVVSPIHAGKVAKPGGTLRNGRYQVGCYMRPATKAVLVQAAKKNKLPLANFIVLSALQHAGMEDRVPASDIKELYRQ